MSRAPSHHYTKRRRVRGDNRYECHYERCGKEMYARGGVIVLCDDRVLVVRGREHQQLGLPKGRKNKDETLLQAAERELKEETGLVLNEPLTNHATFYGPRAIYYVVNVHKKMAVSLGDAVELDYVGWMSIDELRSRMYRGRRSGLNAGLMDFLAYGPEKYAHFQSSNWPAGTVMVY